MHGLCCVLPARFDLPYLGVRVARGLLALSREKSKWHRLVELRVPSPNLMFSGSPPAWGAMGIRSR
jgi:hypothetical protein